ncbi:DUF2637 domain-containing protein [Streptomyces olivochromogenes]|uniref:DUF2637 domain-containing protein n=1 Tax=Streptomyces olivochromogenes TaxID=1963 RepID=UPI001F2BE364|nr:DUF2637 domain-containing protein [Streptomyces olivochromogenes]
MQKFLVGVVVGGAVVIAGIGFAGSYAAVRELALKKGFGNFAYVFPIGIDAGICVLLALDLLLTWIRIPFPLLRQTAWLLTVATIAFNGAAAWPDPLGVGMHAVIPILFVVCVEAARHAIGRIADITADKHMEGVRLTRWLLSPLPTFLLWRRMKLWELRSYEQVIKLEQDRLVYQARLHSRFGRAWRRKAPVESMMPLRLARYGVPLAETAPSGLAAAGIEPALLPPAPVQVATPAPAPAAPEHRELESSAAPARQPQPQEEAVEEDAGRFAEAYQRWIAQVQAEPTASQFAAFLRSEYGITTAAGGPLSDEQLQPLLRVLQQRYAPPAGPAIAPDGTEGVPEEEPSSTAPGSPTRENMISTPMPPHSPRMSSSGTASPGLPASPSWARTWRTSSPPSRSGSSVTLSRPSEKQPLALASRCLPCRPRASPIPRPSPLARGRTLQRRSAARR